MSDALAHPPSARSPGPVCRWPDCCRSSTEGNGGSGLCSRDRQRITKGFPGRLVATVTDAEVAAFAATWTDRRPCGPKQVPRYTAAETAIAKINRLPHVLGVPAPTSAAEETIEAHLPAGSIVSLEAAALRRVTEALDELGAPTETFVSTGEPPRPAEIWERPGLLIGEWQEAIYETIRGAVPDPDCIDGSGSDSDEMALTIAEVSQGLAQLQDLADEREAERDTMRKERDEARATIADGIRVVGEVAADAQRQIEQIAKERDEARAEVARLQAELAERRAHHDVVEDGPATRELWSLLGEPEGSWPVVALIERACERLKQQREMMEEATSPREHDLLAHIDMLGKEQAELHARLARAAKEHEETRCELRAVLDADSAGMRMEVRSAAESGWRSAVETLGALLPDSDPIRVGIAKEMEERARAPGLAVVIERAALSRSGSRVLAFALLPVPASEVSHGA